MHYGHLWEVFVEYDEAGDDEYFYKDIVLYFVTMGDSELEIQETVQKYLGNTSVILGNKECIGRVWLTTDALLNLPQNV